MTTILHLLVGVVSARAPGRWLPPTQHLCVCVLSAVPVRTITCDPPPLREESGNDTWKIPGSRATQASCAPPATLLCRGTPAACLPGVRLCLEFIWAATVSAQPRCYPTSGPLGEQNKNTEWESASGGTRCQVQKESWAAEGGRWEGEGEGGARECLACPAHCDKELYMNGHHFV